MIPFILAFLIGDLYLQTFTLLPEPLIVYLFGFVAICFYFFYKKYFNYSYVFLAFALGFVWSFWYVLSILTWQLPKEIEGKPVLVNGFIASIPMQNDFQTHFLFTLKKIEAPNFNIKNKTLIKLSSRENKIFHVGQEWQFLVKLKRIHGTQNPGAFDYEAWALQKGLRATGYIIASPTNKVLSHYWYQYPIDQVREYLYEQIKQQLPTSKSAKWLPALIIGERNGIAQEDWKVLRNTGTNHLMAIAGLHIGIMAGFAHWLVSFLWRRNSALMLLFPAQQAGACAALFLALVYSALAGFSIPTQRASIMLTVFILALLSRRNIQAWHSWAIALLIVLLLNPLAVLTESLWLSFGTIALIIYGMSGRLAPQGFWWRWGRVQWVIGVGLTPLTLIFFQQCSFTSFLANSIAIPWLGFFILPFCFLSAIFLFFSSTLGGFFLMLADKSLALLWIVLTWFSQFEWSTWIQIIPHPWLLVTTLVGILFLLLPASFPGRWLGFLWMLPIIFYMPDKPKTGDFWLTLLDVGQGLSAVIQTRNHILVYDTGAKLNSQFDMGESVVLPFLQTLGAKKIDMLVISHSDNDHFGGAQALLNSLAVSEIKTSTPGKFSAQFAPKLCLTGESWQWDGVQFSFLYPSMEQLSLGNDSSCVLKIENGDHQVLLTGDIEKYAQNNLLKDIPQQLAAEILIAPHHGSKTSGSEHFIRAVFPKYVLYATGYKNRYHFPHPKVVLAYENINTKQLNTAETGAIKFEIGTGKILKQPILFRDVNRKYWY